MSVKLNQEENQYFDDSINEWVSFKKPIITDVNLLHRISLPSTDKEEREFIIKCLEHTLKETEGIGLSAIQIGIEQQVLIIRCETCNLNLFNPEIISKCGLVWFEEGCLSLPEVKKERKRWYKINVKNGDGNIYCLRGLESIAVQHEIDHFFGITLLDEQINL